MFLSHRTNGKKERGNVVKRETDTEYSKYFFSRRSKERQTFFHYTTHLRNVFKALPEVRLNSSGIFGLGENLQQLIIREEVESWEGNPLGLQIFTETFLHLLQ